MAVEVVPARHGRGPLGWLMGPVSGYYLAHPDEPSVYLTSDAVLTNAVLEAVERLQPDVLAQVRHGHLVDVVLAQDLRPVAGQPRQYTVYGETLRK